MRLSAHQEAPRLASRPGAAKRPEEVIIFSVARQTFAIAAADVQEIRSTDSLAGAAIELVQDAAPQVQHMIERSHRAYYVVNSCAHFHLPVSRPTLVLVLREHRAAVLVERIERMAEIAAVYPLPRAFQGLERRWYRGLAYFDDRIFPVIEPSGFISPPELHALDELSKSLREEAAAQPQGAMHS